MTKRPHLSKALPGFAQLLRHFAPEIATQRMQILGALGILFLGVAIRLLEPWPLKFIIDAIVEAVASDGQLSSTALPIDAILLYASIGYIAIVALRATASYHESVSFAMIGNRVISRIRTKLYRHLQSLPLSFHNRSRQGDLLMRMTGDVKLLRDVTVTALLPLLGGVLVLAGMIAVMLWINWRLALVAVATLPLFAISAIRTGGKIHEASRKQRQREGALATIAAESISSMQVVKALSLESRFEGNYSSSDKRSAREEVKTRKLAARLSRTTDLVIALATAVVLWYGGHLALSGAMSVGDLVVFLTYLKRGLRPLQNVAKYAARLAKATAAGERIVELLEIASDVTDSPGAVAAPALQGEVSFESVNFEYEPGVTVLDDFDLTIKPGEFVAIVGTSGAGKSTVLNLLSRFYEPKKGTIRLDGHNIQDWTIASVRAQTSVVLQETVLFAVDVWENIAFGAQGVSHDTIEKAARDAGAYEFLKKLPQGYETILGERGVNLSHGQRQRIAIARAMVRDAPLILLDEPATALDQHNKRLVRESLARLIQGRTTLLVTHDLQDARFADRIILMEEGRVVEEGTHDDLIKTMGRYAELHQLQNGLPHQSKEPINAPLH